MTFSGKYSQENSPNSYRARITPETYQIRIDYETSAGAQVIYWNTDFIQKADSVSGGVCLKYNKAPEGAIEISDTNFWPELTRLYPLAEFHQPKSAGSRNRGARLLLVLLLSLVAIIALCYFVILPFAANQMAKHIPVNVEQQMGDAVYQNMTGGEKVNQHASELANNFFQQLHYKSDYHIKITIVESDIVNAYALPGGNIVVYTGIIKRMNDSKELAALLSHEFSHVQKKHSTRSLCRSLAGSMVISLIVGDAGGITATVLQNADQLKQLSYSRNLEQEADDEGMKLLRQNQVDLAGMKNLFEALKKEEQNASMPASFLSTHPLTDSRIKSVTDEINKKSFEPVQHPELDSLFTLIKGENN